MIPMEVESSSSSELEAEGMEGYDDEIDSASTSWYTLSTDRDTAEPGLLRRRHSYSPSLSSSSSLRTTCRRPDGMIIKAQYGTKIMIFELPVASSLVDLEKNVTERLLELKVGTFRIKYQDDEGDWILITNDDDLHFCMASLRSVEQNTILMLIEAVDQNTILMSDKAMQDWQRNKNLINRLRVLAQYCRFLIVLVFVLDFWRLWTIEGEIWITYTYYLINIPLYILLFVKYQSRPKRIYFIAFGLFSSAISIAFCSTLRLSYLSLLFNSAISWASAFLNQAGKVTLINSVLHSILMYQIAILDPPVYTIRLINRILSNFFWGSSDSNLKVHWIAWDKCCQPTNEGGVGIRAISDIVQAYSIQLWWRFRCQTSLWSHFMLHKYCGSDHPLIASSAGSGIWRRMCSSRPRAGSHIAWIVGQGNCSLWHDNWSLTGCLSQPSDCPYNQVREIFVSPDQLSPLSQRRVGFNVVGLIHKLGISLNDVPDRPCWTANVNGKFSLASAWEVVRTPSSQMVSAKFIWHKFLPRHISLFMWKLWMCKLPIDENIIRKGIQMASRCSCCRQGESETFAHVFLNSPEFWKQRICFIAYRLFSSAISTAFCSTLPLLYLSLF